MIERPPTTHCVFITPIGWQCTCGTGEIWRPRSINTFPDSSKARRHGDDHATNHTLGYNRSSATVVDYRVNETYEVGNG